MLSPEQINTLKSLIGTNNLVYRDVDGGIHKILGYYSNHKEKSSDPSEIGEPVFVLRQNKCIATDNIDIEDFFLLEPAVSPGLQLKP